ncbi:Uma2 family endonuclease [Myxococcota bacterium]|nr:Uma2 family endonuclease [Myxococcota bacterium]
MAQPVQKFETLTYAEAKAIEDASDERHVLWDGVLYAMAGATYAHNELAANLLGELYAGLRGTTCRPLGSDMRLRPLEGERFFYADVVVRCGPPVFHPEDELALTNPTAVFEVLSPSTERFDRTEKFAVYREMPSVQLIVFLRSDVVSIYRYERAAGGWVLTTFGPSEQVPLLHGTFAVDDVYRGVHFSPLPRLL